MNNNQEINNINKNLILNILFITSVIISAIITYNEKLRLENKKVLFNENISKNINLLNRLFSLILVIGFLTINKEEYQRGIKQNKNIKPLKHQLYSSYLTLASALITLYVVYENQYQNFQVANIENPNI